MKNRILYKHAILNKNGRKFGKSRGRQLGYYKNWQTGALAYASAIKPHVRNALCLGF